MQMALTVILPVRRLAEFLLPWRQYRQPIRRSRQRRRGIAIHRWLQKQGGKDYRSGGMADAGSGEGRDQLPVGRTSRRYRGRGSARD